MDVTECIIQNKKAIDLVILRVSEGTQYWGLIEQILCRVMILKNPIVVKGRESGSMLSQHIFKF